MATAHGVSRSGWISPKNAFASPSSGLPRPCRDSRRLARTQDSCAATLIPWPPTGGKRQTEFSERDQTAREAIELVESAPHAARHSESRDVAPRMTREPIWFHSEI